TCSPRVLPLPHHLPRFLQVFAAHRSLTKTLVFPTTCDLSSSSYDFPEFESNRLVFPRFRNAVLYQILNNYLHRTVQTSFHSGDLLNNLGVRPPRPPTSTSKTPFYLYPRYAGAGRQI